MLVPKLRFKREDGTDFPEWEEKRIGEILTLCHGKDYKHLKKGDIPVMGTGGVITYVNEALCDWQCVCIGRKGTIDRPYFMDKPFWSVDTLFYSKPLGDNMPKFQYYLFQNINWLFYNEASGVPSLSASTIENIIVKVPTVEEQQKIADFLSNVDEVIAQSEAEVANLQQQKKAAMQKIFSQEVRFNREDRTSYPEWEEKKLGAIGKAIIGSGFSKKYQGHKDLPIPFYKVSDMNNVGNEIVMNNSNNYVSKELLLKMGLKACQQNAIIFAKVGAALMLDRKRIANKPFLVDNNMMIFMPNENNELRYIYHWLTNIRLSKYAQIGALPSFNASDIEYVVIPLPCLEEQQKIADFLATYDEAISCAKQELDKWKELKKGLLQQMFA